MKKILMSLVIFLSIALGGLWFLGETTWGFELVLRGLQWYLPGKLEFSSLQGKLFREVRGSRILYQDQERSLIIQKMYFRWRILSLFHRKMDVQNLSLTGVVFQSQQGVSVKISRLTLQDLQFAWKSSELWQKFSWQSGSFVKIHQAHIQWQKSQASLEGGIFQNQGDLHWQLRAQQRDHLFQGNGHLQGGFSHPRLGMSLRVHLGPFTSVASQIQGAWKSEKLSLHISKLRIDSESLGQWSLPPFYFLLDFASPGQVSLEGRWHSQGDLIIQGRSRLDLTSATFFVSGKNILLVDTQWYRMVLTPDLTISYQASRMKVTGQVTLNHARLAPEDFGGSVELPDNTVVLRHEMPATRPSDFQWVLDLVLNLEPKVEVIYQGLVAKVGGKLQLHFSKGQLLTATGELKILQGHYQAYGQSLKIQRGELLFWGGAIQNPAIHILATKTIPVEKIGSAFGKEELIVGVEASGNLQNPELHLYSTQSLSEADILSYLIFGKPLSQVSSDQAQSLLQAASLLGLGTKGIGGNINLESRQVYLPQGGSTQMTMFVLEKDITEKLSVSYGMGVLSPISILRLLYQLSSHWAIQGEVTSYGQGGYLLYQLELP